MAYWEKLLPHVVQELDAGSGSGSSCSVGDDLPRQCVELGPRVRVQDMRVLWLCARWAGISVTLSELGERRAEQADPGPRPGSMDRSSLLQLIQEQVRGGWELALPWRPSSR